MKIYNTPKNYLASRVGYGTFFGGFRDIIQDIGEGIQLPFYTSRYFQEFLTLISYHVKYSDWIPLSNVIFLPLGQKVRNMHNNAILLANCTLISALSSHISQIQKWIRQLLIFMCIKQLWNTAAYLYKKMLPQTRAR